MKHALLSPLGKMRTSALLSPAQKVNPFIDTGKYELLRPLERGEGT